MPLPESGRITIEEICEEFGVTASSVDLSNDLAPYIGITAGERVTIADFYGASSTKPSVQTSSSTSVAQTSMTINANVTAQGSGPVTSRGFWFGTANTYNGEGNVQITVGSGTGTYSSARTGLTADTTYYIFAFATNNQGTTITEGISQATQSASLTPGSIYRDGTTSLYSIANRLVMYPSEEPTTDLRMGNGSTFTINMWIKVGFTSSLSGQGRYQQLFGWAGEAIHEDLLSNIYNNNLRIFYDEAMNRLWVSFLADDTSGTRRYSQNFWFFHKNSGSPNISTVTGLGTTYWANTNRGDVNDNDYTMLTFTVNGGLNSSQLKLYWNGNDVGTPFYSTSHNNGTPANATDIARGIALLGAPYSANSSTYGGTFTNKAGYLGGNGDTYVDEVSIWDSALSSSELETLYNEGEGGTISTTSQPEGLISYWNFDSTSQDTTNKTVLPIWPDPSENEDKGKIEIDGTSGFGSGSDTING